MNDNSIDRKIPQRQSQWWKWSKRIGLTCVFCYVGLCLYLKLNETSLVYPGGKGDFSWNPDFPFEDVWVDSTDGSKIHGWYLPRQDAERNVLVFHGNEEDVAKVADRYARKLGAAMNANVLVFDYRGYGKSTGTPYEKGTIDDGEAMLKWLLQKVGSQDARKSIDYFGSSLGGGVSVGLAERFPPKHLILDRTFDAIYSAGAERYPWAPVKLLMSNKFESAKRIAQIDVPLFQSHYTNDELCSLKNAKKLFAAAATSDKTFLELPVGGHYDPLPDEYWVKLNEYFDNRSQSPDRDEMESGN